MTEDKKCMICGTTTSEEWIVKENLTGEKAYFCGPEHYSEYKKKASEIGICEFC